MGKLAEAYVDIGANLKPMEAGLGKAKAMLTSFASKGFALSLGAAGGAGGIAAGLFAAAKKSADLGESISKVKVVFGKSSGAMIDQADDLAKRFGVVKQSALDAASGFGLMGRAAGMSQEAAAKLGQDMVSLGLDMASFHNLSNEEAFEKLRSGLAGESEPLRPLGILLSEDAVKAEALAMGLTRVKRELTDQEKVVARLSLIRKQAAAGGVVGDLARTADSNANQLRKMQGELENAAVEFGAKLQDALRDGISLAHELGKAIQDATGKSFAENVGEATRAAVNTGRMAVAPGGGGFFARAALLGTVGRLAGAAGQAIERQQLEGIAAARLGLPLAAAGNGWGVGNNGFRAAGQRQAGIKANQDWHAMKEAERLDLQKRNDAARDQKLRDQNHAAARGIGAHLFGQFGNVAGALAPGAAGQRAINAFGANLLPGLGLGKAAGGLIQGGLAMANRAADAARKHADSPAFQSQSFSSGNDFAKFAIEKALSNDHDKKEKELQALEQARDKLGEIKGVADAFLNMVLSAPPLRAILRGAS